MAARRPLFRPSNRAAVGSRPSSREEQEKDESDLGDGEPGVLEERRQLRVSFHLLLFSLIHASSFWPLDTDYTRCIWSATPQSVATKLAPIFNSEISSGLLSRFAVCNLDPVEEQKKCGLVLWRCGGGARWRSRLSGSQVKLSGVEQCVLLQCELSGGDVGGYKMVHLQCSHILV